MQKGCNITLMHMDFVVYKGIIFGCWFVVPSLSIVFPFFGCSGSIIEHGLYFEMGNWALGSVST